MLCRVLLIALVCVALPACESREEMDAGPRAQSPLRLDPMEDLELAAWWMNGDRLLFLDDNGHYLLYEGANRYRPAIEQGRWGQVNYATLRLEPYGVSENEPRVGKLDREDGDALTLSVPGVGRLTSSAIAPEAPEDDLIGTWTNSVTASLVLENDMTYAYTVLTLGEAVASRTSHGRWRYDTEREEVVLERDDLRLRVEERDEETVLVGPNVELRHGGQIFICGLMAQVCGEDCAIHR